MEMNILEASVLAKLYQRIAVSHGPSRFVNLCDSSLTWPPPCYQEGLCHRTCRRPLSWQSLLSYPGNPSRSPHERQGVLGPSFWTESRVVHDALRPRLRRWAANWCRLVFCLLPSVADLPSWRDEARHPSRSFRAFTHIADFDSSLGFPSEGPPWLGLPLPYPLSPFAPSPVQGLRVLSLSCPVFLGLSPWVRALPWPLNRGNNGGSVLRSRQGGQCLRSLEIDA